jgi:hypothetical protein
MTGEVTLLKREMAARKRSSQPFGTICFELLRPLSPVPSVCPATMPAAEAGHRPTFANSHAKLTFANSQAKLNDTS